jgi:hypothetical protein
LQMRHIKLSWATAFAAGMLFIAVSPAAKADSTLTLTDGTNSISLNLAALGGTGGLVVNSEGLPGGDCTGSCSGLVIWKFNTNTEDIEFVGNLGAWSITVDSGIANIPNGSGTPPTLLDLDIQATNTGAGTGSLTGNYDAGVFNSSIPGFSFGGTGSVLPATGTNSAYVITSGPTAHLIGSVTAGSTGSFADPTCSGSPCNTSNLDVNEAISGVTSGGVISDDFKLSAVPEPTSIALLGAVLLFAGSSLRRKFQKG